MSIEGWEDYTPTKRDRPGDEMAIGEDWVERRKVPEYFDEVFRAAFQAWLSWKKFGLPYSGGEMDQPANWRRAVAIFDDAYLEATHRKRERERSRGSRRNSSTH